MKESVSVPVVANGDIRAEEDVTRVHQFTGANGTGNMAGLSGVCSMYVEDPECLNRTNTQKRYKF